MYAKQLSDSLQGIFDAAIGFHDNKMDSTSNYDGTDELHNLEISTYYSFDKKIGRLHLIPKYKISFKDYENGDNSSRSEFLHNASIALNFVFSESVKLSASYLYTVRDATGNENDYSSYDVGGGLTLTVRF